MNVLVAVIALLGGLTALNLFLLLGVIRRLREMAAGAGSPMELGLPAPGDPVGEFSEKTVDGAVITDAAVRDGRSLVLFLSPSCQPCQAAADRLVDQPAGSLPPTLVFVHTEPGDPKFAELRGKLDGIGVIAPVSGHSSAARAFGGVAGYPTSILVEDGTVTAASMDLAEILAATQVESLVR